MDLQTLVNATDLTQWAHRTDAQCRLPLLIRQLIHATVEGIHRIDFPAEEGVQLGGYDGIVELENGNAYVPDGFSVWEMGTNRDIKGKADADYEKRCKNPRGVDPATTAFVFVTPRRWSGKEAWIQERQTESFWCEVRAYDADDLEQWLYLAPAVHIWLSVSLGKHPETAEDINNFWADWSEVTKPPIGPRLLTAGREEQMKHLRQWLAEPSTPLAIKADTREESVAFFASTLHQLSVEERLPFFSRIVLVKDSVAWHRLCTCQKPLILVPRLDVGTAIARATRGGHAVYLPLGRDDSSYPATIELPRLGVDSAQSALSAMGLPEQRAKELARLARRSLMALRRKLALNPEIQQPSWAKPQAAHDILAAVLVGGWNDASEADRKALEKLAATSYDQFSRTMTRWANEADPPVRQIGNQWYLVSKEDAWSLLARYTTTADLEQFGSIVIEVLGEPEPQIDVLHNAHRFGGLYSRSVAYSESLHAGLADTLAIMGAHSDGTKWGDARSPQEYVDHLVYELLEAVGQGWRLWTSLSYYLPDLAEASPSSFLAAVENSLTGGSVLLVNLFEDSVTGPFPQSSHTGLRWALELLAWSPAYLARTALCLATLARIDPGGKLINRPDHSLRNIFLCWHPSTYANLDQRLQVVDLLRKREPEITWQLMIRLLPEPTMFTDHTRKPRWRDWIPETHPEMTLDELFRAESAIVDRLLVDVYYDGKRWTDLLAHLDLLQLQNREHIIGELSTMKIEKLLPAARVEIWTALRSLIQRHTEFPTARWAMPKEATRALQEVYERFTPDDDIGKHSWLFSNAPRPLGTFDRDSRARDQALILARNGAVNAIWKEGGLQVLLALASSVEQPEQLGLVLGRMELIADEEIVFLARVFSSGKEVLERFGRGFVGGRFATQGWKWAEARVGELMSAGWPPEHEAMFLTCLPFECLTWDFLLSFGSETQERYWLKVDQLGCPISDADRAIRELLAHDRPHDALQLVLRAVTEPKPAVSSALMCQVLQRAATTEVNSGSSPPLLAYYSGMILDVVEASGDVDKANIAALELTLLPFLEQGRRGPTILHRELSSNPELFIQAICLAYPSEVEEQQEEGQEDDTKSEPMVVSSAPGFILMLLHTWRQVPGTQKDGSIDETTLKAWVEKARAMALACNRVQATDAAIGRILSQAPQEPDVIWPPQAVRDIIDDVASKDLDLGFRRGLFNNRGAVIKALAEGGTQERQLVQWFRDHAAQVRNGWPRTSALLDLIATRYATDARSEDMRAELIQDMLF